MTKSDRILKESCIIAEELYWQDFFERVDEEPDTTIPEGQFERILSLIHQQPICEDINLKTLEKRTVFSKRVKAVLVAAIVILLLAVTAMAITPFRNFIIKVYKNCTAIVFNLENKNDYLYANYEDIPEGYELKSDLHSDYSQLITYTNGYFDISINTLLNEKSMTTLDTENSEINEIMIGDLQGYYSLTETNINLIWSTGKYNHCIFAELNDEITIDLLVKIAQSRQPVN